MKSEDKIINFGILTDLVGYHIRMAQIAVFRDFAATMRDFEISPTQFGTLVIINANPGIKQKDLANAIQLDRSSVVPMINRLENKGLVSREKLPTDRRSNALRITPEGIDLLNRLLPLVREHEQRLLGAMTEKEGNQLVNSLKRIFPE